MNVLNESTNPATIVQTSRFGEITVDQDRVITLINPFLGFSESTRFLLRPHSPKSPFMWLQSLDNPELAFVVIAASILNLDYRPPVPAQTLKDLQITSDGEQDILLILTIPRDNPQAMTANLLGPVVLNSNRRLAMQIVLDPNKYDPCWPLFADKASGKKKS